MKRGVWVVSLLTVATAWVGCDTESGSLEADCQPEFPYLQGWLGGDAASSAALTTTDPNLQETLWFFGDTFVGTPDATNREGAAFLNNTIARSRCDAQSGWLIEYGWAERDGRPASVFVPPTREDEFYWPLSSASVSGIPYVFLSRTRIVEIDGVSTFEVVGTDVARVNNPDADVSEWDIQYSDLLDDRTLIPASAAIESGDFLYVVGYVKGLVDFTIPRFMSRISIESLEDFDGDLGDGLEIWDGSDWVVGAAPEILMDDAATEMGIQRLPDGCGWMVSYQSPIQPGDPGLSQNIYVRTAPELQGPWSERRLLATTPEMDTQDVNGFVPGTLCYAAKLQPQFGTSTRLSLTYVCNIWALFADGVGDDPRVFESVSLRGRPNEEITIWNAMNVYVPRALSLPFPTPGNRAGLVDDCPWLIE